MSITPAELKDYSTFKKVKNRSSEQLEYDILEAESYINDMLEKPIDEHVPLPKRIRLALLKISQFFALVNSDEAMTKGYKSEKISDYSYTLADGSEMNIPSVQSLLGQYLKRSEKGFHFKVRSL